MNHLDFGGEVLECPRALDPKTLEVVGLWIFVGFIPHPVEPYSYEHMSSGLLNMMSSNVMVCIMSKRSR